MFTGMKLYKVVNDNGIDNSKRVTTGVIEATSTDRSSFYYKILYRISWKGGFKEVLSEEALKSKIDSGEYLTKYPLIEPTIPSTDIDSLIERVESTKDMIDNILADLYKLKENNCL